MIKGTRNGTDRAGSTASTDAGGRDTVRASRPTADIPAEGSIVRIGRDRLRMLGVSTDALILATAEPPFHLYLVPDEHGTPSLIRFERWRRWLRSGAAQILSHGPPVAERPIERPTRPDENLAAQIRVLNDARVPNGAKAIAVYLHQHWGEDLVRRFGEALDPNTLRRWRIRRKHEPPA